MAVEGRPVAEGLSGRGRNAAEGGQGARDLKGVYSKRVENTDFYTKEKIPLDKMKWDMI